MSSENQATREANQEFISKKQRLFSPMAETSSSSNGSSAASVTLIPEDHLFSILLLLPVESILCFAMTCKKLKSLAYSDSLWESICKRDWGHIPVDSLKGSNRLHQFPWKKLYHQVYFLDSVFCTRLLSHKNPDSVLQILPCPRASHSLNLVSGCLVLFGGGCEGGRHCDDTWVAYIGNDFKRKLNWQKIASGIPSGRFGHSCIVINDSLILFGGINDHGARQNDTWIGRLTLHDRSGSITLSWRLLDITSTAPPPRGAHACCSLNNKRMVIHGGIGLSGLRLGDTWILNLSEDLCFGRWAQVVVDQNGPPSRSGHTLTHIGGEQTILFGGRGVGYEVLHDVWLLDGAASSDEEGNWRWRQVLFELHSVPRGFDLPRVGHSASLIIGRRLLIYGGEDSNRRRKDDFWVLDIGSMVNGVYRKMWRRVESEGERPNCRSFHGGCVDDSGRFLYVHGGMVDGVIQPSDPSGLRFDGESFVVEVVVLQQP
ncbi:hypothetical protein ABFX02_09G128029 [Erythranthe guttata]